MHTTTDGLQEARKGSTGARGAPHPALVALASGVHQKGSGRVSLHASMTSLHHVSERGAVISMGVEVPRSRNLFLCVTATMKVTRRVDAIKQKV